MKSHRFDDTIKRLAAAVNLQQEDVAWQILHEGNENIAMLGQDLIDYVAAQRTDLRLIKAGAGFDEIYYAFSRFQVLCSNREGKNSVSDINYRVKPKNSGQKFINLSGLWYSGRPVMVTQNNRPSSL